ncbi:MAG: histidine kinase [Nocardiaceae bacterium]|nr:histidine kinase [Nocardiaceae bacterium]
MGIESTQNAGIWDRAYQRLGWRWLVLYPLAIWTAGLVAWGLLIVDFARLRQLTAAQVRELAVLGMLLWFVCVAISVAHSVHTAQPVRRFERGEADAEEAWRAVVAIPGGLIRANYAIVFLLAFPFGLLLPAAIEPLTWPLVGIYAVACAGIWLYCLAAGAFLGPTFARPVLRVIRPRLTGPPPAATGMLLTTRLIFVVPGLSIATGMIGSGVGMTPGQDLRLALTHISIATVLSAAAAIPITMLLAKSVRDPIEDLLDGTKRVQAADYRTEVPELSTDELGQLARSFNEAMTGLSERQKLSRENLQLLDEVRASRTRIVAAADASRRRIERNLHDGAQQRLVAVALDLSMLQDTAPTMSPEDIGQAIGQASMDVKEALSELRELARGLHPAVLSSDGLAPALNQLATRSKMPVAVNVPDARFPAEVETAAYFVAAEALANVAKYSRASQASVSVEAGHGRVLVYVCDDGIGGATLGNGTGLAGLADRVEALDGKLTIESPAGHGTTVMAEIPVDGDEAVDRDDYELEGGLQWARGY